jgi:hypothetical protein
MNVSPLLVTCFHADFLPGLFFDPEDGGDMFLQTLVHFQLTTWHYIPEGRTLRDHRCENLISVIIKCFSWPSRHMPVQDLNTEWLVQWKHSTVRPLFIVFVGGLKKKQWIRESNRCGSHSLNRICSGTIEIERQIRENELSGNDR